MIRYLSVREVLRLHRLLMVQSGGAATVRDLAGIESAVAQPRMTFGGDDLYPTLSEKAVAIGFSLIRNHPFTDGNKRVGHAAMELMLAMNGFDLVAPVDAAEAIILGVAAGDLEREALLAFVQRWSKSR
ncbi:type II toxin-antitoxin system death-on-curing family toxin [Gemmatimonas sp.]|uniref:type II toxin-antitoxin system death-on-curing family toxin n=1 Tax=Gemmatimonas sp. TaxID=1962908 RepID=UPI00398346D5